MAPRDELRLLPIAHLGAAIIEVQPLERELDPGVDEAGRGARLLCQIGHGHAIAQMLPDDPRLLLRGPPAAGLRRFSRSCLFACC